MLKKIEFKQMLVYFFRLVQLILNVFSVFWKDVKSVLTTLISSETDVFSRLLQVSHSRCGTKLDNEPQSFT